MKAKMKLLAKLLWVCCFFSFTAFVYVIAFQIASPNSVYWGLSWWLPIRLDYFGEAGFIGSFIFAIVAILVGFTYKANIIEEAP
jgi:predicted permease